MNKFQNAYEGALENIQSMDKKAEQAELPAGCATWFPLVLAVTALVIELLNILDYRHITANLVAVYWAMVAVYWSGKLM